MNGVERLQGLHNFSYKYLYGPVSEDILKTEITEGNCRLAVQDYFYTNYGIYLDEKEIVLPEAKNKGIFIENSNTDIFLSNLKEGDIVYAEKFRNSLGKEINFNKKRFVSEDEWLINLHLGIYLGVQSGEVLSNLSYNEIDERKPVIWHSSFISGGTSLWSVDKFCEYYKPVIARRLL